jgi:tetratricopeptide (TPR) repeat protein
MASAAGTPVKTRRALQAALAVCALAVAAGLGWYAWRWYHAPVPPAIALEGADPAVVRAVEAARRRVESDPYSAAAWGDLAMLLRGCELYADAAKCFAQAGQLDPNDPRWPYLQGEALSLHGDPDAALPALQRAEELCTRQGKNELPPRVRLAEALLAAGRFDEAEAPLRRALAAEGEDYANARVHLDLGLLACARGNWQEAHSRLRRCEHSKLAQKTACGQLATVYARLNDAGRAAEYSRRAAALPPDQQVTHVWLRTCLERAPGKSAKLRFLDNREAQGSYREAADIARELLEQYPGDYKVLLALGRNLAKLGDFTNAEEALRQAVSLSRESVQAYYYLGKIAWFRGESLGQKGGDRGPALAQYRAAADLADKALAQKPDYGLAHLLRGQCLGRLGQKAEAIAALRQAVACAPDIPEPSLELGEALREQGELVEARTHLEYAARVARPEDPRPREALKRLAVGKPKE